MDRTLQRLGDGTIVETAVSKFLFMNLCCIYGRIMNLAIQRECKTDVSVIVNEITKFAHGIMMVF